MTKKAILLIALVGLLHAAGTAFALTGALGTPIASPFERAIPSTKGKIDLRDGTGAVTFYYWGGTRCPAAVTAPTDRQVDILLSAHLNGHAVSLDYANFTSSFGASRCWDGGIQVY